MTQQLAWPASARWWQSARLALGTASALGLARFAYGLLVPAMRAELHWSLAQAGALTTANGVGYLLGAVAMAPVAGRLRVPVTFRLGMVLTAAALAATAATSGSYPVDLLSAAPAGVTGSAIGYGATFLSVPAAITTLVRAVIPPMTGPGPWPPSLWCSRSDRRRALTWPAPWPTTTGPVPR